MAPVPLQQDEVVEMLQLCQALLGVLWDRFVSKLLGGMKAEQDCVQDIQVNQGARRIRVAGGLFDLVL